MKQRGRKSAAYLAADIDAKGIARVGAPPMLSDAERAVWMATVNSKPADWFGLEHVPLLVDYVRHICKADVIDAQIKAFEPEWLAADDGLKRYGKLIDLAVKTSAAIKALATSMRLTQQTIYRADKAGLTKRPNGKLWVRED